MAAFNSEDVENVYESHNAEKQVYLHDLRNIILDSKTPLEGNAFYEHRTLNFYSALYNKQVNLFWCGQQATTKICEIGFNAGHSVMLMLLGRPQTPLNFTIFDIGMHAYTKPCVDYIRSKFRHVSFDYIEGDSTLMMPAWIEAHPEAVGTYDVVHVDGGHSEHCAANDMQNADRLVKMGGLVILDDTNDPQINKYADMYLGWGKYQEVNVLRTTGYCHRILKKIK